jgi:hypothetical protein
MTVKVAINGFGRIGRNVLRAIVESGRTDIEVVALNDLGPVETNAHLLRFDSVHGRFPGVVTTGADWIDAGRGRMRVTALRNPAELPWGDVDIVMECTGIFTSKEKCQAHLENGSKRVLISAPGEGADKTIVYGVNHDTLTGRDLVVSNASCTTNCLSPVAKVLNEAIGIEKGMMTTIHSYTGDQPTLDTMHKDLYRARAAALSMIPTSTGAAKAVGLVLPELKGRLDGFCHPGADAQCLGGGSEVHRQARNLGRRDQCRDQGRRRGPDAGHPGLYAGQERLLRLQPRPALQRVPHGPDQGHGWHHVLHPLLVRQRMGLLKPDVRYRRRNGKTHLIRKRQLLEKAI